MGGQTSNPLLLNTFEIVQTGFANVSSNGSTLNWTTIPHNLGFAPIPLAFYNGVSLGSIFTNGNLPLPSYSSATIDTVNQQVILRTFLQCGADENNVYLVLLNSTGATIAPLTIKFYLLREKVN